MNSMTIDTPDAPWNEEDLPERTIEVEVTLVLRKTFKISVDDYDVVERETEDGKFVDYDYSRCDLAKALSEQYTLPQYLPEFTEHMFEYDLELKAAGMPKYLERALDDCKYWKVDEIEINYDE